jgi:hypothetical protein
VSPVEAIKLQPLSKGWVGISPSVLRLTMIDFMYSPRSVPVAVDGPKRSRRNRGGL